MLNLLQHSQYGLPLVTHPTTNRAQCTATSLNGSLSCGNWLCAFDSNGKTGEGDEYWWCWL